MIPAQVDYVRPPALADALRILSEREGDAKVLAGGYSLIPLLKLRLAQPGLLVDLRDIEGLDHIVETDDELVIGARVTHAQIHSFADPERQPVLREVSGHIGDPQVRNWGTIGGSIAHADPAADWPAVLLATRATIVAVSGGGERRIPAREFFLDTFTTALEPTEIVREIRFPRRPRHAAGAYAKFERKTGDFATAGACAVVILGADGRIDRSGVALTAVAETPFAATDAEAVLDGSAPSEDLFRRAGAAAGAQARPAADVRGPIEYKRAVAAEMVVRALRTAVARAMANG